MENAIILHGISLEDFYGKIRSIIKEELKQDQLLTREGAMKMAGISKAALMKAIDAGIVKPQLIKDRKRAMYLESEILKIQRHRKTNNQV